MTLMLHPDRRKLISVGKFLLASIFFTLFSLNHLFSQGCSTVPTNSTFTCGSAPVELQLLEPGGDGCQYYQRWTGVTETGNAPNPQNAWSTVFTAVDSDGLPAHPTSTPTATGTNCNVNSIGDNTGITTAQGNPDDQVQMDGWLYVPAGKECVDFIIGNNATDHSVAFYIGTGIDDMALLIEDTDGSQGNTPNGDADSYSIPTSVTITSDPCNWQILRWRIYVHDEDAFFNATVKWSFDGGANYFNIPNTHIQSALSAADNTAPVNTVSTINSSQNALLDENGTLWEVPNNCTNAPTQTVNRGRFCVNVQEGTFVCDPCQINVSEVGCNCNEPNNTFAGNKPNTVSSYYQTLYISSLVDNNFMISNAVGITVVSGPTYDPELEESVFIYQVNPGVPYSFEITGVTSGIVYPHMGECALPDECNCPIMPEICGDNLDNDCDGLTDAADPDVIGDCMLSCEVTAIEIQGKRPVTDKSMTSQVWGSNTNPSSCCVQNGAINPSPLDGPTPGSLQPFQIGAGAFGLPAHINGNDPTPTLDIKTLGSVERANPGQGFTASGADQIQQDGWLLVPPGVSCLSLKVNHPGLFDGASLYLGTGISNMNFVGSSYGTFEYTHDITEDGTATQASSVFTYNGPFNTISVPGGGCTWSYLRVRIYIHDTRVFHNTRVQWNIGNGWENFPSRFIQSVGVSPDSDNNEPTSAIFEDTSPFCAFQDADGDLFLSNGAFYQLNPRQCEQIVSNDCLNCAASLRDCSEDCIDEIVDPETGQPIEDQPQCNLELFTVQTRVPTSMAGGLLTRFWDHNDGNGFDGPLTQGPVSDAFSDFANTGTCPNCLPQHPNDDSPTGSFVATSLGIGDATLAANDGDGDVFTPNAISDLRNGDNMQQDGWLIIPAGIECVDFRLGGFGSGVAHDASSLYLGVDIDNMTFIGENRNRQGENNLDFFSYEIPSNAQTVTSTDCVNPYKVIRVRFYHHDRRKRSNTIVYWNIGNGFNPVPNQYLRTVNDPCDNTLPVGPTLENDGSPFIAVLEDLNQNMQADEDERWFLAPDDWTSCDAASNGFDINMIPIMERVYVGDCDITTYIPCALCCELVVTCPPTDLGTITCNDAVPAAATTEDEFEALGGDIANDPGFCGTLVITHVDEFNPPTDICNGRTLTRTYTIADDETSMECVQTLTISAPNGPTITCPADMTVECFADIVTNADDATVTTDCAQGFNTVVTGPVQSGDADCPMTTYTYTYTVTDDCGRTASCEQVFTIQNLAPIITCPADEVVACFEDIVVDPNNLTVITACGQSFFSYVKQPLITGGLPGCDGTVYTYIYKVTDACGRTSQCEQQFLIQNDAPSVVVPADETVSCVEDIEVSEDDVTVTTDCIGDFTVNVLPPVINGDANCPGTTYTYTYRVKDYCNRIVETERVFTIGDNGNPTIIAPDDLTVECQKTVNPNNAIVTTSCGSGIDYEVSVSDPQIFGIPGCNGTVYRYTFTVTDACGRVASDIQNITLANEGPVIDCPETLQIVGCQDGATDALIDAWIASVTANSSCGSELTVTNNYNGNPGMCIGNGYTNVTFRATDECGRTSTCVGTIAIIDTDAPIIYQDPQEVLVPCNGVTEDIFENWLATQGGAEAIDGCWGNNISWSTNPSNPQLNCAGGPQAIVVEFIARDGCGNTSSVTGIFNTKVQPDMVNVSGAVERENTDPVANVQVAVSGGSSGLPNMDYTENSGAYGLPEVEYEDNLMIVPEKNDDLLNGVTTFDLIILQQHILNTSLLDSPYKKIAADVNRSGGISTFDLVLLRRLILHVDEEFSNNTSWRFVEANYVFPNPENPFETTFPEAYSLDGGVEQYADFIGVKIGDLNLDAIANEFMEEAEDRTGLDDLIFEVKDQSLLAGEEYRIDFTAKNFNQISGFQFTLNFDKSLVEAVSLESGDLNDFTSSNYGMSKVENGAITVSWNDYKAQNLKNDEVVFSLVISSKEDTKLSEVISISSEYTRAEAYQSVELMNVALTFNQDGTIVEPEVFKLFQNQPNPFKDATMIGFNLPEAGIVSLKIYDVSGRLVYSKDENFAKGYNQINLEKRDLPSGVLYYHLNTATDSDSKKMILLD